MKVLLQNGSPPLTIRWFFLLLMVVLAACVRHDTESQVPEDEVRTLCEYMVRTYPAATLQDVYKTCYQDFFGAEHMIQDTAAARKYLRYELNELRNDGMNELRMPLHEPTGFRHRFERINLSLVLNGEMTEDELLRLFIEAAGDDEQTGNRSQESGPTWPDEWAQIEAIALDVQPAWQNEELQALLHEAAANKQAVRHSEAFRIAYKPHYRIIRL